MMHLGCSNALMVSLLPWAALLMSSNYQHSVVAWAVQRTALVRCCMLLSFVICHLMLSADAFHWRWHQLLIEVLPLLSPVVHFMV
jgi:hypothetical protein